MPPLFPIPTSLILPAADAQRLYEQGKLAETVELCRKELTRLEKEIPAKSTKPAHDADPASSAYQYFALTLILTDALTAQEDWKAAKEALGKFRVRFPRDPWGFSAGAEVTRRDPQVHDPAAVQRAIELLEGEANRLNNQSK